MSGVEGPVAGGEWRVAASSWPEAGFGPLIGSPTDAEWETAECGTSEFGLRSSDCGIAEEGGVEDEDEDEHDVGDSEMGVSVSEGEGARLAAERAAEKSGSDEEDAECALRNAECGVLEDDGEDEDGDESLAFACSAWARKS